MKGKKRGQIICDECGKDIGMFVCGAKCGGDYCDPWCAGKAEQRARERHESVDQRKRSIPAHG